MRLALVTVLIATACVSAPPPAGQSATPALPTGGESDTTGRMLVPPGYGSLHQDDIALHLDGGGVLVRAVPLNETLIRLLTPDSYRALHDLRASNRAAIAATVRRYAMRRASPWLVSFYGVQPDARFTAGDLIISSSGRDFRAYDIIPLTVGFGEGQLAQRATQSAIYVFDGDVDVEQPLSATYEGVTDNSWEATLQRIERERALVRARASKPR